MTRDGGLGDAGRAGVSFARTLFMVVVGNHFTFLFILANPHLAAKNKIFAPLPTPTKF